MPNSELPLTTSSSPIRGSGPVSRPSQLEPDEQLLSRAKGLIAPFLSLTGNTRRYPPHRLVEVTCSRCHTTFWKRVNDLQHGRIGCRCQWDRKYEGLPWAPVYRQRYNAMVQRCVTNLRYVEKGIEVRFDSASDFIRWASEEFEGLDPTGLEFDRIDNNGHYERGNLRLVTTRVNSGNRRNTVNVQYMGQTVARDHLWDLVKTDRPDFPLKKDGLVRRLQRGLTVERAISGPFRRGSTTSSMPDPAIVSLYRG